MFLLFHHITKFSQLSFLKLLFTGTKGTKTKKSKLKFVSDFSQDDT